MSKADAQIESEVSTNGSRAEWGAWSVVAGLVLEIIFATAKSLGYEKPAIENWGAVIADCLVGIGVYAEIHFGRKASDGNSELRRRSDERAARLEKEAAELRARTGARLLNKTTFLNALAGKSPPTATMQLLYSKNTSDGAGTAAQLNALLIEAKWSCLPGHPISGPPYSEFRLPQPWATSNNTGEFVDVANSGILIVFDGRIDEASLGAANVLRWAIQSSFPYSCVVSMEGSAKVISGSIAVLILPRA